MFENFNAQIPFEYWPKCLFFNFEQFSYIKYKVFKFKTVKTVKKNEKSLTKR